VSRERSAVDVYHYQGKQAPNTSRQTEWYSWLLVGLPKHGPFFMKVIVAKIGRVSAFPAVNVSSFVVYLGLLRWRYCTRHCHQYRTNSCLSHQEWKLKILRNRWPPTARRLAPLSTPILFF
jgi:hypothetical protein